MSEIKNVALAGASGNLGPAILNGLLEAKFHVTVLVRPSSKSTFPAGVTRVEADFTSLESLTVALKGQDAVVCTFGTPESLGSQPLIVDAAIAAGVKLFVPSEFGCDLTNPRARILPVYGAKVTVEDYLKTKAAEGKIAYAFIYNGAFLDWGLQVGFLQNPAARQATLHDGGDNKFSATTLPTVGAATAKVLAKFPETKNKEIRVHEAHISLEQLLAVAKELTPGEEWKVETTNTADLEKKAYEDLQSGNIHDGVWYSFLFRAIFGEGYGGGFEKTDNALYGVKELSDADLKAVVAKYVKKA
ncbi:oxidoreductase [Phlyctema vagabunda]|uniref:Oxidoreductase n=1 Tax=Phlyctema vagabunda TaxID=108571 RepID=A0ABR4PLB2_9HELO